MKLEFTARKQEETKGMYTDLEFHGLDEKVTCLSGDGKPDAPYLCEIQIFNKSKKLWKGILSVELNFEKKNPRFYLPGFLYGRNRGEAPLNVPNEFPRLREQGEQRPASSWWMTRSDRLSHPAALVYDTGRICGLSASPYFLKKEKKKIPWKPGETGEFFQYAGFSCSLKKGSVGYTLGYENAPWHFIQSHKVEERQGLEQSCFELLPGEKVVFQMEVYNYEAKAEQDVYEAIEAVYGKYHQEPRRAGTVETAVKDISEAVSKEAWIPEEHSYSGFVFEKEGDKRTYRRLYSLTWTNGLSVAVPMLQAGIRTEQEKIRQQALESIESIIAHSINKKTGLPYTAYDEKGNWSNHGWWFDGMHNPGHPGYFVGQAAYYILKAWQWERDFAGICHKEWMEYVRQVIEQIEKGKNQEEEYPYIFSEQTGAGLEYDSMGSAWCMAASACYSYLQQDFRYLDGLKHSEEHYYQAFVEKAECYGGPLDTDKAVDSEGVLGYIRALPWLYRMTGDEKYLDHLRDGLSYEFTFKCCYNSPIQVPPLNRIGWSSCGGSITSVANPHIHPMSSTVIDEMFYYLSKREDVYIKSRLRDTILWSCQTYSHYDKEYDYGYKGWMSERFCHSQGLLVQKYPNGSLASTWFALMPWACGCILEGLCGTCWEKK